MNKKTLGINNPPEEKIKFILELFNSSKLIEAKKEVETQKYKTRQGLRGGTPHQRSPRARSAQ